MYVHASIMKKFTLRYCLDFTRLCNKIGKTKREKKKKLKQKPKKNKNQKNMMKKKDTNEN